MALSSESLKRWNREQPNQLPALVVGLIILVVSVWVGRQAKAAQGELAGKKAEWQRSADQLATVQQRFRVPSATESAALIAESARLGALGVPSTDRVSLMELLVNLAEASTLADVRVNFGGTDTTYLPTRSIGTEPINRAPYAVTLDFTGSFAGVVKFVSSLPPSVSLSRLGASRHDNRTVYHVFLSVYEIANGNGG